MEERGERSGRRSARREVKEARGDRVSGRSIDADDSTIRIRGGAPGRGRMGVRGTHRRLLDDVQDGDRQLGIREGVRLGVDFGHGVGRGLRDGEEGGRGTSARASTLRGGGFGFPPTAPGAGRRGKSTDGGRRSREDARVKLHCLAVAQLREEDPGNDAVAKSGAV